jgi:hypothetical protein
MIKNFQLYIISFITIGVFIFSDVYLPSLGRVFDYVFLVTVIISLSRPYIKIKRADIAISMSFLIVLFPWLVAGAVSGWYLLAGAIFVGVSIVFPIFRVLVYSYPVLINKALRATIFISIIFLVFQFLVKTTLNIFLDFHAMIGSIDSRSFNEDLDYFRPAGLFQEPNAYCTVMFCLISARKLVFRATDWVDALGIGTLLITQSLWGFGAVAVLLYIVFGIRVAIGGIGVIFVLLILGFYMSGASLDDLATSSVTIHRIVNIEDDPSRQARLGSSENIFFDIFLLIGHGVNSQHFQTIATNSYAFIISSFGLIGTIFIFIWIFTLNKIDTQRLIAIAFLFTTFPAFSYMYFWVWFTLVLSKKEVWKSISHDIS